MHIVTLSRLGSSIHIYHLCNVSGVTVNSGSTGEKLLSPPLDHSPFSVIQPVRGSRNVIHETILKSNTHLVHSGAFCFWSCNRNLKELKIDAHILVYYGAVT